jgi:hypothetical protein
MPSGVLIADAFQYLQSAGAGRHPCIAPSVTILALNFVGEGGRKRWTGVAKASSRRATTGPILT